VRRLAAPLALLAALVALAGCGLGAGDPAGDVTLTVSDDFGTAVVLAKPQPERAGDETVMRLLQRNAKVRTRFGGNFVQAIDGRAGGRRDGRPVDWFFYVNGIEAGRGATDAEVHDGDRVWWDRHDWGAAMRVPAVVGSFPEPFKHGTEGRKIPVRVECGQARSPECRAVAKTLGDLGVVAGQAGVGVSTGDEVLRVLVGPWPTVRRDLAAAAIERGPKASGVYARMSADGRALVALDERGAVARRLGAGTGLVAATQAAEQQPTWIVTGTDAAGLASAARAFAAGESALSGKFALAVSDDRSVALPVVGRR
jgi:hypothetical protein